MRGVYYSFFPENQLVDPVCSGTGQKNNPPEASFLAVLRNFFSPVTSILHLFLCAHGVFCVSGFFFIHKKYSKSVWL
jgi:hypothetical protein